MIFGFNTDIRVDDTVYHVQSEARTAEKLLQTQVFVKGYCIGKRAISYADDEANGQTEDARHELLRSQHRTVVQAVREGHLDSVIQPGASKAAAASSSTTPAASAPAPEPESEPEPAKAATLELKFLSSIRPTAEKLLVRFSVELDDSAAEGATVVAQILADPKVPETFSGSSAAEGKTNRGGMVELSLPLPPNPQGEASLVVKVSHSGVSKIKKFRIKTQA
jgi:ribosomal protein L12E/L44/L45/RPP1/RPP2